MEKKKKEKTDENLIFIKYGTYVTALQKDIHTGRKLPPPTPKAREPLS